MTYSKRTHGASVEERFWAKVDKNGPIVRPELGSCWIWTANKLPGPRKYGTFSITSQQPTRAHRFAWELEHGPIPKIVDPENEICVLHRCDNPPCVRESHLFLGTKKTNCHDSIVKGRKPKAPVMFGSQHPNTKISNNEVREIRLAASVGASNVFQARLYGVDPKTIYQIVSLRRRKGVT